MRRLVRPLLAATLLLFSVPGAAAPGERGDDDLGACRAKDQIVKRKDRWLEIKAPKVIPQEGPRTIVDFATPPRAVGRIYTTNGRVIKASVDAGCTWDTMPGAMFERVDSRGTVHQDVFTHLAATSETTLWAASYDDAQGANRPHVYVGSDLEKDNITTTRLSELPVGMPAVGKPVALVPSLASTNLVYVVIEGPPDPQRDVSVPGRRLFVSLAPEGEVGAFTGLMWHEVALPAGLGPVEGVAPTAVGRGLYVWSGDEYAYTADSAADAVAWQETPAGGDVVRVDVNFQNEITLVVNGPQGAVATSLNSTPVRTKPLPVPKAAVFDHGSSRGVYVVSGSGRTLGFDRFHDKWVDITPRGVKEFTKMQIPAGAVSRAVVAQAGDRLYRWNMYEMERFLPPPTAKDGMKWLDEYDYTGVGRPELTPTKQVVKLRPGQLGNVPVKFRVDPSSTKLNVYFLVDDTASMDRAIQGLKASTKKIAVGLKRRLGDDACFGVGSFRDFLAQDADQVYLARQKIVCEKDPSLPLVTQALDKLKGENGGDTPEAQTVALTQAVTGEGSVNPPVLPGQDAGFQVGAFKVIVLVTDADFKQRDAEGFPSIDTAVETLDSEDIKVVGILLQGGPNEEQGRRDLQAVAAGTNTFAPPSGVDCDGDGQFTGFDLSGGAPLVCDASGSDPNIGPAILSLVLAVADPGTLAVDVHDEHDVVKEPILGLTRQVVNLKRPPAIDFTLPVRCAKDQDGLDLPVQLVPTVRNRPIGLYGEVVVQCRALAVVVPPVVVRPPLPQQPEVLVEPRPPKPPVAIALPQPPPAPAQPVSNINLNAGMSQEEQQEYQLATVGQGANENEQPDELVELAMSDYRERDAAAGAGMLAGATLVSAAGAVAYRRRLQRSHRTQSVRIR